MRTRAFIRITRLSLLDKISLNMPLKQIRFIWNIFDQKQLAHEFLLIHTYIPATTSTRSSWLNLITSICIGKARDKKSKAHLCTNTEESSKAAHTALTITTASDPNNWIWSLIGIFRSKCLKTKLIADNRIAGFVATHSQRLP